MRIPDEILQNPDGLSVTLGITYHSTDDPLTVEGRLTCRKETSQPWGLLSGGATITLAENLAGVGSMCLCPDKQVFGINITANHMNPVPMGETAIATARLIRKGGRLHHWLVDVKRENGDMVSEIMVTNYVRDPR